MRNSTAGQTGFNVVQNDKKIKIMKTLTYFIIIIISFSMMAGMCTKQEEDTPNPSPVSCSDLVIGGKTYKTVKMGNQCWMAENLDYYAGSGSWDIPFEELEDYGKLYNYNAAKIAAPEGWHLPTLEDWLELAQYISDQHGGYEITHADYEWSNVGGHLKATNGWGSLWAGTDDYGFTIYPAGNRHLELSTGDASFDPRKHYAIFWTTTQELNGRVRMIMFKYDTNSFYTTWLEEVRLNGDGYSVRYVKD